jgi:hypothetical protein
LSLFSEVICHPDLAIADKAGNHFLNARTGHFAICLIEVIVAVGTGNPAAL